MKCFSQRSEPTFLRMLKLNEGTTKGLAQQQCQGVRFSTWMPLPDAGRTAVDAQLVSRDWREVSTVTHLGEARRSKALGPQYLRCVGWQGTSWVISQEPQWLSNAVDIFHWFLEGLKKCIQYQSFWKYAVLNRQLRSGGWPLPSEVNTCFPQNSSV